MKDVIAVAETDGENKESLAMENVNKTAMIEVAKVSSAIDLRSKHSWAIGNADMDVAGDLGLISIKKFRRRTGQIQNEVDWLHKDWIPTLGTFIKYSRRTHDNEEITENMIIRHKIDSEWALSLFV